MEYQEYLNRVFKCDFISDYQMADAAVKATLGVFASEMKEPAAKEMTKSLPEPLSFDKLRSHQKKMSENISFNEYLSEIAGQFHLKLTQSAELVDVVLRTTKDALDEQTRSLILQNLPAEWSKTIAATWQ